MYSVFMENKCCICCEKKNIFTQLIYQPCGIKSHRICKSCLTKTIETIPINEDKPVLKCQYPFSECHSKKVYKDEIISKFLKERFFIYKEAKLKYSYPDYFIKECNNCFNKCFIKKTTTNNLYNFIYNCSYCSTTSCFTCDKTMQNNSIFCEDCYFFNFYNNPLNFSYFFFKPKNKRLYLTDYKINNVDLDSKFLTNFITKRFQNDDLYVTCPVCETMIEKSEDCNAVFHCHVEICNVCGMFSNIGEKLYDHWSSRGIRGCPRWDGDSCITSNVKSFICVEKQCYGHIKGNCDNKEHLKGIEDYKNYKKNKLMYHYLINIPRQKRIEVIDNLPISLLKYLPSDDTLFLFDLKSFTEADEYKNF